MEDLLVFEPYQTIGSESSNICIYDILLDHLNCKIPCSTNCKGIVYKNHCAVGRGISLKGLVPSLQCQSRRQDNQRILCRQNSTAKFVQFKMELRLENRS